MQTAVKITKYNQKHGMPSKHRQQQKTQESYKKL